jgi:FAD/FMN-containing dehydrogenase
MSTPGGVRSGAPGASPSLRPDQILRRGEAGYEEARRATVWNGRKPDRFPDVVVRAEREDDVVAAVRLARDEDLRIGVRSGGHSWAGSHVRDGGMLLDVSAMTEVMLDVAGLSATAQPGRRGSELSLQLAEHGLFFPTGHCDTVAIGGYLLQGGYGWDSRVRGPACMSVTAIDVVTADGELVRADAHQHPDLFWAARGAGPGFFGVITRFHLRVYPRPAATLASIYNYPPDTFDEVFTWAREIAPEIAPAVEFMMLTHREESLSTEGPVITMLCPAIADSDDAARDALALFETCPARERVLAAVTAVPADINDLTAMSAQMYPPGKRYAADNMWTSAPIEDLLPGLRAIQESLGPAPSHMLWMNWSPASGPARPDMAYSMEDDIYLSLYTVWDDPAEDAARVTWTTERMRAMEPVSTGIQLADENLGNRPWPFAQPANMERLDRVRAAYDPDRRFHPWLGRV